MNRSVRRLILILVLLYLIRFYLGQKKEVVAMDEGGLT